MTSKKRTPHPVDAITTWADDTNRDAFINVFELIKDGKLTSEEFTILALRSLFVSSICEGKKVEIEDTKK